MSANVVPRGCMSMIPSLRAQVVALYHEELRQEKENNSLLHRTVTLKRQNASNIIRRAYLCHVARCRLLFQQTLKEACQNSSERNEKQCHAAIKIQKVHKVHLVRRYLNLQAQSDRFYQNV